MCYLFSLSLFIDALFMFLSIMYVVYDSTKNKIIMAALSLSFCYCWYRYDEIKLIVVVVYFIDVKNVQKKNKKR